MKQLLTEILKVLVLSVAIEAICVYLGSPFLADFLRNKTVELLITLMAINTATSSFIVSKLQEVAKDKGVSFADTYREIKISLLQQLVLIIIAVIVLTIEKSTTLVKYIESINAKYIFDVALIFVFVAALDILRDTGIAMFDILLGLDGTENRNKNNVT